MTPLVRIVTVEGWGWNATTVQRCLNEPVFTVQLAVCCQETMVRSRALHLLLTPSPMNLRAKKCTRQTIIRRKSGLSSPYRLEARIDLCGASFAAFFL